MTNELSPVEVIQRQIIEERQNYRDALLTKKPLRELKQMKAKIEYLESCIRYIQHEYKNFMPNEFPTAD